MKIVDGRAAMMDFRNVAQGAVFSFRDDDGKEHYFIKVDPIQAEYDGTVWNAVSLADGEHECFNACDKVCFLDAELVINP
mgnify:CR=1 FL=1